PLAQPRQVRGAELALALADHRALVQHLLRQRAVVGGEARDGALEVLRDHAVELQQLRLARLGEAPRLVELLAGELHQVLVHDVADVLEVADEGDEPDLLAEQIGRHGLLPQARQEELDLALEVVELVVAALHVLEQLLVVPLEHAHGVAQHALGDTRGVKGWMNGNTRATPISLKPMCATATRRASADARRLAASAVAHVPILAPSTIGMAPSSGSSPCWASERRRPMVATEEVM